MTKSGCPVLLPYSARKANVYQLVGHTPDVATMANTRGEARAKIASILGVDKLPSGAKVERIR